MAIGVRHYPFSDRYSLQTPKVDLVTGDIDEGDK